MKNDDIYLVCRKYEYGEEDEYGELHIHYEVISGFDTESLAQMECDSLNKKRFMGRRSR